MPRSTRNLTGRTFNQWTVLSEDLSRAPMSGRTYWICVCACGSKTSVAGTSLIQSKSKRCKACSAKQKGTNRRPNLLGKGFGRWSVVSQLNRSDLTDKRVWLCRCTCGHEHRFSSHQLTSHSSNSCKRCAEKLTKRLRPYEALYNRVSYRATTEGHPFELSYPEFLAMCGTGETKCHYCFAPLVWAKHSVNKNGVRYNIDRKDNGLGYVSGNVVPCCKRCNWAKSSRFSYEEWWAMTEVFRKGLFVPPAGYIIG